MQISSPNYVGNLAKIKTLKRRMDAWDMISPFVISELVDPFALSSVEDRWGNRKLTGVNLLKNLGKLTLNHCRSLQQGVGSVPNDDLL
jgi:hypothetical protein